MHPKNEVRKLGVFHAASNVSFHENGISTKIKPGRIEGAEELRKHADTEITRV